MAHLHLIHRSIRLVDNTSLIAQLKQMEQAVTPIFIFTPEQIDSKKNEFFTNGSVQFMIESLHELSQEIKKKKAKLYFFHGDTIKVLKSIHKSTPIESISFNVEYTPYGRARNDLIKEFCESNNIACISKEDYALFNITEKQSNKADGTPYLVYTPFMRNALDNLEVRPVDKFRSFKFKKIAELEKNSNYIDESTIDKFYKPNPDLNVHGGRSLGLKILNSIEKFKDYGDKRDYFTYKTTFLGAYLKFNVLSIREVYHKMVEKLGKKSGLVREILWREFYLTIYYNFPRMLQGQIKGSISLSKEIVALKPSLKGVNKSFKEEYDGIKWSYNKKQVEAFLEGKTGFPIVDACVRDINRRNFMHNRGRMIVASFLAKDLHLDFKWIENWFATRLVDYDPISNSGGVQWSAGNGTDAQPWFRIFNPWTQQEKFDTKCDFIYSQIPELKGVDPKDVHNWSKPEVRAKYPNIDYPTPIVDHDLERKDTIERYKKALK
jgi:deoxyribodipyrimidine photo-lyase